MEDVAVTESYDIDETLYGHSNVNSEFADIIDADYALTYDIVMADGTPAPTWIDVVDLGGGNYEVQVTLANTALVPEGNMEFAIKTSIATTDGDYSATKLTPWTLELYTYEAPDIADQVYVIGTGSSTYNYAEYPVVGEVTDTTATYTQTCEIWKLDAMGGTRTSASYDWLTFVYDGAGNDFDISVDSSTDVDMGQYFFEVECTLVGPAGVETTKDDLSISLVDIVEAVQTPSVYIIGDTDVTTVPIVPFTCEPVDICTAEGFVINYSQTCSGDDQTWSNIDGSNNFITGPMLATDENEAKAQTWTCTLTGTLGTAADPNAPGVTQIITY